jgi:hypothetical protein
VNLMRYLDKLIYLLVSMPPLYMMYRFVRWYVRTEAEPSEQPSESEALG